MEYAVAGPTFSGRPATSHWPDGIDGAVDCGGEHAEEDAGVITSVEDWTAGLVDDGVVRLSLGDDVGDDVGAKLEDDEGTTVKLAEDEMSELADEAMDVEINVEDPVLELISDVTREDETASEESWLDAADLASQVPKSAWHPFPQYTSLLPQ